MEKRFYTFIVAHHATARLHKIRIPRFILYSVLATSLVGIISIVVMTSTYIRMVAKTFDYNTLRKQKEALQLENLNMRVAASQIDEKLSVIEALAKKLSVTSGLDKQALKPNAGGIGGFREPAGQVPNLEALKLNASGLEFQLRRLDQYYVQMAKKLVAMPSLWPVHGYVTGGFGLRNDPLKEEGEVHVGVDISTPYGNKIIAPADGLVIFAEPRAGYGNIIVLDHGFGVTTRYGHLSAFNVKEGQYVKRGDVVGYVGSTGRSTGAHLHYEIRIHDNPVNPMRYMKG
ncbi:MAG: M23 family metallopeptidase [Acidobacteriia bacterium]|nr:M23 family metallopeptidase [Terriglobia bacterium]